MIRSLDTWAHTNRWSRRGAENAALAGGLLLLAMLLPPFPGAIMVTGAALAAATLGAGIPPAVLARVLTVPLAFLVSGVLPLLVSIGRSAEGSLTIRLAPQGMATVANVGLRSMAAVSALTLLSMTTSIPVLMSLLRRAHVPADLTDVMSLTYRLLFLFDDTLQQTLVSQTARLGYASFRAGLRSTGAAVAVLFTRTLTRAQRLERGLASRAYDGSLPVLDYTEPPRPRRMAAIATCLLAIATATVLIHAVMAR